MRVRAFCIIVEDDMALLKKMPKGLAPLGGSIVVTPNDREELTEFAKRAGKRKIRQTLEKLVLSLIDIKDYHIVRMYFFGGILMFGCAVPTVMLRQTRINLEELKLERVNVDYLRNSKMNGQIVPKAYLRQVARDIAFQYRIG